MKNKEQITQYVSMAFDKYQISPMNFFTELVFEYDDLTPIEKAKPLFDKETVDEKTLEKISVVTGLSLDEIINCDQVALTRYENKYPYVSLVKEYKSNVLWNKKYSSPKITAEDFLVRAVFGEEKTNIRLDKRYDYKSIKKRMIEQLKEIDKVMPNTYHKGAEITNLEIHTEEFISFPEITKLVNSFCDMVDNAKRLFFKALYKKLTEKEILEYNFLVYQLDLRDVCFTSKQLNYDYLQTYKSLFVQEGYEDFYQYALVRAFIKSCPWRCKEFFDDTLSLQRFVDVFPQSKSMMREFATKVGKFSCVFVWSDAKPIELPELEIESDLNLDLSEFDLPLDQRKKEPTFIYVDKNAKELDDCARYITKLNKISSPTSKGGVSVKRILIDNIKERFAERVKLFVGGGNNE